MSNLIYFKGKMTGLFSSLQHCLVTTCTNITPNTLQDPIIKQDNTSYSSNNHVDIWQRIWEDDLTTFGDLLKMGEVNNQNIIHRWYYCAWCVEKKE